MIHSRLALYGLILSLCLFIQAYSQTQTYTPELPFPQSVLTHMATRQMRYHHYLWHQIRDNWNQFSSSTQREFRNIGWEPPSPARDRSGNRIRNNYAGEDFLYMHRNMIASANQVITQNNEPYGKMKGWTTIPAPGDATYPVPASYPQGQNSYKSNSYYNNNMRPAETRLKNPSQLRRMTLNELGLEIESGLHTAMHLRWSSPNPVGFRTGGSADNGIPNIPKRWDDVRYNWLADSYGAHVNPIFFKLHCWIDDRVEDWRKANNLTAITWRGSWAGGPMNSLSSVMRKTLGHAGMMEVNDPEAVGDVLEKTLEIFLNSGVQESWLGDAEWPEEISNSKTQRCRKNKIL